MIFELEIGTGAIEAPAVVVSLKYIFAYALFGKLLSNVAGIAIIVVVCPEAANVPEMFAVCGSNKLVFNVYVAPLPESVEDPFPPHAMIKKQSAEIDK